MPERPWERRYETEWVSSDSLVHKSFENPNRLTPKERAKLKKSLELNGICPPLLVRKQTNEVIDGEHRWELACEMDWEEVPVIRVPMTDAQARIIARQMATARGREVEEYVDSVMKELASLGGLNDAQDALLLSDEEIRRWDEELEEEIPDPLAEFVEEGDEPADTPEDVDEPEDLGGDEEDEAPSEPPNQPVAKPRLHRVNVLFRGDEADLVKRLLGQSPGLRIVEMCRYWEKNDIDEQLLDEEEAA